MGDLLIFCTINPTMDSPLFSFDSLDILRGTGTGIFMQLHIYPLQNEGSSSISPCQLSSISQMEVAGKASESKNLCTASILVCLIVNIFDYLTP